MERDQASECARVCVCVCVCMREGREREGGEQGFTQVIARERERETRESAPRATQHTHHAECRASSGTCKRIIDESGKISGRKDRVWGQTGVKRMQGTEGATIGPPALSEYAVDPVGVAIIIPSACTVVKNAPLT